MSRATFREMIYSRCSEPLSHTLFRYQSFVHSVETSYCAFIFYSRRFLKIQLEGYFCHIPCIFFHQTINHIIKGQFTRSYSLLPHLNLGTRFLVVEEICNIPSITLQESLMIRGKSSCFTKLNHVGIISPLKSLLWILFKFKVKFEVAQKLLEKCSSFSKYSNTIWCN